MYRVFLGAPTRSFLLENDSTDSEVYQNTIFHNDNTTLITWPPTVDNDNREWDQIETLRSTPSSLSLNNTTHLYSRSIAQFPCFHFNPNTLSSLSNHKTPLDLLVVVLDVDPRSGTDTVRIKNGPDAGNEVAVLRMVVGDEEGRVAKLTAWRDVAQVWGDEGVKRGDVVLIENLSGSKDALVASPYWRSRLTICYRTLPREDGDQKWRPDLRLGATDAAVRKVAAVVKWFEGMVGVS